MTWFKIDDGFWAHPKVLGLTDAALALWVRAGSYCAQQLTDGRLLATALPMLRSDEFVAAELVKVGLWYQTPDGYEFHDWAKYQPTRASIEAEREQWRERQRNARAKRDDVTRDTKRESRRESSSPVPSRPVHDSSNDESQKREGDALDVAVDTTFEQVWAQWPKKTSKKTAQAKFVLAARRHPDGIRGLAAAVVAHARAYSQFGHPIEFVPMLSTWLNGDRWTDPLPGPRSSPTSQQDQNRGVLGRYTEDGDHE